MAKRSMTSRIGMLALSFALVFSLMSPTWLFAAEMLMPESEEETSVVIEEQAPAPVGEKETLEMGPAPESEGDEIAGGHGPNVNEDNKTYAYSGSSGEIVCPGDEVVVTMEGYYDGTFSRDRGVRISLPNGVTDFDIVSAEVWRDGYSYYWGGWNWVPGQWYDVASSYGTEPDGPDRTWWQVTTNDDVLMMLEQYRVVVEFTMPCENVVDPVVESGSRYGLSPYNWFWGNDVSLGTIYAADAGLGLSKGVVNGDDPTHQIQAGTTVDVTVDIYNSGNVDLGPVDIMDALPMGFAYDADSAELDGSPFMLDSTTSPGYVLGEIAMLEAGESVTLTYSMLVVDAAPGHYDPIVSVSADNPCCPEEFVRDAEVQAMAPSNGYGCCERVISASTSGCINVHERPNLEIDKTVTPNTGVEPGDVLDVEITIENVCEYDMKGEATARAKGGYAGTAYDVVVNDTIPAGFTYVPGSAMISINGADPVPASAPTTWPLGDMAPCDLIVITYQVLAGDSITPGFIYGAGVSVTAEGQSPVEAQADVTTAEAEEEEAGSMGYNDWLWIAMVLALIAGSVVAGRLALRDEH